MPHPLVSTIIPAYNRAEMLGEAVESVIAQSYRPIEIIIVDDGSTDETPNIAEEFRSKFPEIIRVIHQRNAGPGAARQAGFEASRGEFVQFLDSDDLLRPNKFALQVQGLLEDTSAGISYGLTIAQDDVLGISEVTHRTEQVHQDIFPTILQARLWPTLTPLYRRAVCEAIGPWSTQRVLEDWDYDCRAGLLGVKLHYCSDVIAVVRHHWGERAGFAWQRDAAAMQDRIAAYKNILGYALRAEVPRDLPEMQHFVRSLFWMSRVAGDYGLQNEAKELFDLSRKYSTRPGWDYGLYHATAKLLGWKRAARVVMALDTWRK